MVLNGKATNQQYPAVHFWAWNSRINLPPTRINKKTQSATYDVGFPSIYQTSEHFRFDLTQRPRERKSARPEQLGIGHTVHISKFVYNSVWSVYYTFTETQFMPSRGVGKQSLKYIMTVLSTVIAPSDDEAWTCKLVFPNGWFEDANVHNYFNRKPDKYDISKIKLNVYFHILLLNIRFPGEVAPEAEVALRASMLAQKSEAMKRLQESESPRTTLCERLLDIIAYHDLLLSHLQEQSKVPGLVQARKATLAEVKMASLPVGTYIIFIHMIQLKYHYCLCTRFRSIY